MKLRNGMSRHVIWFAMLLLLAGSVNDFTRFLVLLVLVALGITWIEVTRSQTLREFPDARGANLLGDARMRLSGWWEERRREPAAPATPAADVSARLANLAELHTRGELTDEEYAAAKARVLAGEKRALT